MLEVSGIRKRFGAVTVLDGVQLTIRPGEVHALMGENGAGKCTLMKILAGAISRTRGEILLDGKPVDIGSPHAARGCGIAHHLPGTEPGPRNLDRRREHLPGPRAARRRSASIDRGAGEPARRATCWPASALVSTARAASARCRSASSRWSRSPSALAHDARVLIMDEPTAALTEREVERLFAIVRRLRERGVGDHLHLPPHGGGLRSSPTASPCCATARMSATLADDELDDDGSSA